MPTPLSLPRGRSAKLDVVALESPVSAIELGGTPVHPVTGGVRASSTGPEPPPGTDQLQQRFGEQTPSNLDGASQNVDEPMGTSLRPPLVPEPAEGRLVLAPPAAGTFGASGAFEGLAELPPAAALIERAGRVLLHAGSDPARSGLEPVAKVLTYDVMSVASDAISGLR